MIEAFGIAALVFMLALTVWIVRGLTNPTTTEIPDLPAPLEAVGFKLPSRAAFLLTPPPWVIVGTVCVAALGILNLIV